MTLRYARAIESHNLALARFVPVQEAYRKRLTDDAGYLAARALMKEADDAFDAECSREMARCAEIDAYENAANPAFDANERRARDRMDSALASLEG